MDDIVWLDWHGCYDDGWKGLISDASFAHPAKAARGLIRRIFSHMGEQGWLPPRSKILDVFGGIGTTAIEGASRGHEVVCIELEERFVKLALENFQLHRRAWEQAGDPLPVILHGDSRKAAELVKGHFAGSVMSPPYDGNANSDRLMSEDGKTRARDARTGYKQGRGCFRGSESAYGEADGQLGSMPSGDVDAVLSSPPYAETPITGQGNFQSAKCPNSKPARDTRAEGYSADATIGSPPFGDQASQSGADTPARLGINTDGSPRAGKTVFEYGQTNGQLGTMKEGDVDAAIGSPPYADSANTAKSGIDWDKVSDQRTGGPPKTPNSQGVVPFQYGSEDGQLGAMKEGEIDAVLSSPPYEDSINSEQHGIDFSKADPKWGGRETPGRAAASERHSGGRVYGDANGQLGEESGETFWQAAQTILEQVHHLLKPGGVSAWIVKDYVKAGKRVPFCDNWARLCEAVGFKVIQRVRCHLVKEETHAGLFGKVTKRTERKSFFRRLHERKPGAVRIDWEEVLFVQRGL